MSFVNVDFTSTNELFAKLFVEKLMENTYNFYKQTKTSQSRANIVMMEAKDKGIKNYATHGQYDFSIEAQSIITDQQRYESINVAAQRAIRAFLAQVSAEGARVKAKE